MILVSLVVVIEGCDVSGLWPFSSYGGGSFVVNRAGKWRSLTKNDMMPHTMGTRLAHPIRKFHLWQNTGPIRMAVAVSPRTGVLGRSVQ